VYPRCLVFMDGSDRQRIPTLDDGNERRIHLNIYTERWWDLGAIVLLVVTVPRGDLRPDVIELTCDD